MNSGNAGQCSFYFRRPKLRPKSQIFGYRIIRHCGGDFQKFRSRIVDSSLSYDSLLLIELIVLKTSSIILVTTPIVLIIVIRSAIAILRVSDTTGCSIFRIKYHKFWMAVQFEESRRIDSCYCSEDHEEIDGEDIRRTS